MKLKKFLKLIDPVGVDCIIWTSDNEDGCPEYKGSLMDIPWYLAEKEIGRTDANTDEPIYLSLHLNSYNVTLPLLVINLI